MSDKNYLLNQEAANHKLNRIALELAEALSGDDTPVVIMGIRNSGLVIAEKTAAFLQQYLSSKIKVISISLDKDHPEEVTLSEPVQVDGLHVIIADDVTNSGKTLLYALKPLLDHHPKSIRTLVLVERMHKLFPVKPDHVGLSVATTMQDHIQVEVKDGEIMGAYIN
jgi:pyrimidine operon attenuation protein/uracil phosphoribosyltransferase